MSHVIIATTTFYKSTDELRFKLACQLVKKANEAGYTVIALDGSPDKSIKSELEKRGALVYTQTATGMAGSRRELFSYVRQLFDSWYIDPKNENIAIVWTEPEKVDIIRHVPELLRGGAPIVIMGRTEESWMSYPTFQVASERLANTVYQKLFNFSDADPMVGPVAFTYEFIDLFTNCNPEKYGSKTGYIQHIVPLEAMASGGKVVCVPVDFMYPPEQREEEETIVSSEMMTKRIRQAQELIEVYFSLYNHYPSLQKR